uniref:(northern house mosquito) hypothetical protein n=1 Tax=Culex pipiens TaxID=7175 RepID=A0A8D8A123_CULPI
MLTMLRMAVTCSALAAIVGWNQSNLLGQHLREQQLVEVDLADVRQRLVLQLVLGTVQRELDPAGQREADRRLHRHHDPGLVDGVDVPVDELQVVVHVAVVLGDGDPGVTVLFQQVGRNVELIQRDQVAPGLLHRFERDFRDGVRCEGGLQVVVLDHVEQAQVLDVAGGCEAGLVEFA